MSLPITCSEYLKLTFLILFYWLCFSDCIWRGTSGSHLLCLCDYTLRTPIEWL